MEKTKKMSDPLIPEEEDEAFKQKVGKFCNESSVFALTRIHNGSRFQRLIWALMFMFMLGMFCYQVTHIFRTYYSYPSEIEQRTYLAPEMAFPAVTVCNLNPARASMARKWGWDNALKMTEMESEEDDLYEFMMEEVMKATNMTLEELEYEGIDNYMEESFNKWDMLDDMDEREEDDDKAGYYETMETTAFVWAEYQELLGTLKPPKRLQLAHQRNDLIVSCKWLGYQCSPMNFTTFLNPTYGVCHTFNSGRTRNDGTAPNTLKVSGSGSTYSLQIEFNIQQHEYINSLSPNAGVRIQIHQPDRMPFPGDDGFSIPPGYLTSVGLKLNRYSHLPPLWGDCEASVNKETLYTQFGANYSIQACLKTCMVYLIRENCSCVMPGYPPPADSTPGDMKMCKLMGNNTESKEQGKDARCVNRQINQYLNGSCDCPRPCQDDVFSMTTSTSNYPSLAYERTLEKKLKESSKEMRDGFDIDENIAKIEVFYQDMQYTETKATKSYETDKLLSDLGGMLGLWLGFSIITIAEFAEFFLETFKAFTKKCYKKKKWPNMTNLSKLKAKQIRVEPTMGLNNITDLERLAGAVNAVTARKAAMANASE